MADNIVPDVYRLPTSDIRAFFKNPCWNFVKEMVLLESTKVRNQLGDALRADTVVDAAVGYSQLRYLGGQLSMLEMIGDIETQLKECLEEYTNE